MVAYTKGYEVNNEVMNWAKMLDDNCVSLYTLAGQLMNCECRLTGGIKWVNNDFSWPERIFGIDLSPSGLEEQLDMLVKGMKLGYLPRKIATSLLTRPEDFEAYFYKHGIEKAFDADGMVLKLDQLNSDYISKIDLDIYPVTNDALLLDFAKLAMEALFQKGPDKVRPYFECMRKLIDDGHVSCYIAYHNQEAVGTSMAYIKDDVVGIYHIASKASYRGKGIGKQITLAPLLEAKEAGYDTAVLFASQLGKPIYEQLGFISFCKLGRYQLKTTD